MFKCSIIIIAQYDITVLLLAKKNIDQIKFNVIEKIDKFEVKL